MTKQDKADLIRLIKKGYSFQQIRGMVDCCDRTILNWMKVVDVKKCINCSNLIGEECGVFGYEIFENSLACETHYAEIARLLK